VIDVFAHRSAGVYASADTHVWWFDHLMSGARVGRDCSSAHNGFVANTVNNGNNVKFRTTSVLMRV